MSGLNSGKFALGASGTLAGLNDTARGEFLDYCPEIRMMFPILHAPDCFGSDPNAIKCLQVLCEKGGIKCFKNATIGYVHHAKKIKVNINIAVSSI